MLKRVFCHRACRFVSKVVRCQMLCSKYETTHACVQEWGHEAVQGNKHSESHGYIPRSSPKPVLKPGFKYWSGYSQGETRPSYHLKVGICKVSHFANMQNGTPSTVDICVPAQLLSYACKGHSDFINRNLYGAIPQTLNLTHEVRLGFRV